MQNTLPHRRAYRKRRKKERRGTWPWMNYFIHRTRRLDPGTWALGSSGAFGSVAGRDTLPDESAQETKRNETKWIAVDRSHINHLSQFRGRKDRLRSKSFHRGSAPVAQRVNFGPCCETGSVVPRRGIHLERITGLVDLTDQFDANHSFAIYTPGYSALGFLYST